MLLILTYSKFEQIYPQKKNKTTHRCVVNMVKILDPFTDFPNFVNVNGKTSKGVANFKKNCKETVFESVFERNFRKVFLRNVKFQHFECAFFEKLNPSIDFTVQLFFLTFS